MRSVVLVLMAVLLPACNDVPWARQPEAAPAATQGQAFAPGATLADGLAIIDATLDSALSSDFDDTGVQQLLRAEALSDRVLETDIPFGWLATQNYSVEARVWQIQAQADRIVARLRAGARREDLVPEAEALRRDVNALRSAIAAGGKAAPAPVDRLLERLDSARRRTS
jgi:hypothetical protein